MVEIYWKSQEISWKVEPFWFIRTIDFKFVLHNCMDSLLELYTQVERVAKSEIGKKNSYHFFLSFSSFSYFSLSFFFFFSDQK